MLIRLTLLLAAGLAALIGTARAWPTNGPAPMMVSAFEQRNVGTAHIRLIDIRTGREHTVTSGTYPASSFARQGDTLAYVRRDGGINRLYTHSIYRGPSTAPLTFQGLVQLMGWVEGRLLYFGDTEDGTFSVFNLDPAAGEQSALISAMLYNNRARLSPSGHTLLYRRPGAVQLIDAASGAVRTLDATVPEDYVWSPDARTVAYLDPAQPGHFHLLDLASGAVRTVAAVGEIHSLPVWSPDSARLVYAGTQGTLAGLYDLDLASGVTRRVTGQVAWRPLYDPTGRYLAVRRAHSPRRLDIYDLRTQRVIAHLPDADRFIHVAW